MNELIKVPIPIFTPNHRQRNLIQANLPKIDLPKRLEVGCPINQVIPFGLDDGHMLLVGLVHLLFLVERYVAQLLLCD